MAVSSLGPNYSDADYMQRDGTDGSGSGSGPNFEDDRDDETMRGSGSGDGPGETGWIFFCYSIKQSFRWPGLIFRREKILFGSDQVT